MYNPGLKMSLTHFHSPRNWTRHLCTFLPFYPSLESLERANENKPSIWAGPRPRGLSDGPKAFHQVPVLLPSSREQLRTH